LDGDSSDEERVTEQSIDAKVLANRSRGEVDGNQIKRKLQAAQEVEHSHPSLPQNHTSIIKERSKAFPKEDYHTAIFSSGIQDFKPVITKSFVQNDKPINFFTDNLGLDYTLHRYAARHLLDHQVYGVKWMLSKYLSKEGGILADSMGMGKTIQVAALMNVIYFKSGTYDDKAIVKRKRDGNLSEIISTKESSHRDHLQWKRYQQLKPTLILCPKTLIDNWLNELNKWGFFLIDILSPGDSE
jgi:SNF2 family DNA or RNA helicase